MSVINTNITSMIGQSNLNKSQNALQTSMERLSSGLRINSAKDDAAGQAIANRFTSQITGLMQAQRNANDGISIAQTAEGSLNQINDNLQRIRELSVQAANGTNSQEDLTSIQDEINQRLDEINRISEETDFNGVRVLAEDTGLKIQVGANDGQTINVGLRQINAQTLGLDGFNVDGSGEIANRAATVTDLTSIGAQSLGNNEFRVVDNFDPVSLEGLVGELGDRDTVDVDGTTYTFSAESGTFSFTDTSTDYAGLAADLLPSAGNTASGTFEFEDGSVANFEVDASGNLTIGGQAAVITDDGVLTANNPDGRSQASLEQLLQLTGEGAGSENMTVSIGGQTFNGTGEYEPATATLDLGTVDLTNLSNVAGLTSGGDAVDLTAVTDLDSFKAALESSDQIVSVSGDTASDLTITYADQTGANFTFTDGSASATATAVAGSGDVANNGLEFQNTASVAEVLSAADGAALTTVQVSNGIASASVEFDGTGTQSGGTAVYVDKDGELTTTASVETDYRVNPETGEVTVARSDGEGKYAVEAGATAFINSEGQLTTNETSQGDRTENPLAALDAALSQVDSLRSELGAVQNRFEDAITNLQTNSTNLSAARSRIEDADYAVEVANMTRAQILQQAGTSVLAQANQIPQNVLSLLG